MANILDKELVARQIRSAIHGIANQSGKKVTDTEHELAELLGISTRTLQSWMNPSSIPSRIEGGLLMGLCWVVLVRRCKDLKWFLKLLNSTSIIVLDPPDRRWARSCMEIALIGKQAISTQQVEQALEVLFLPEHPTLTMPGHRKSLVDSEINWGAVPQLDAFRGRKDELISLAQRIEQNRCRIAIISGPAGVGKTWLAMKLLNIINPAFDKIAWISLRHSPPMAELLLECINLLVIEPPAEISQNITEQINILQQALRARRTIIVLDNFETVLQPQNTMGSYQPQYEGLGRLLRTVVETEQNSCLVLTTREKPVGFSKFESDNHLVFNMPLSGLKLPESREVLKDSSMIGSEESYNSLCKLYNGNPMFLKLASESIKELYFGEVETFLSHQVIVFGSIRSFLDRQIARLTDLEKEILEWMARQCTGVSMGDMLVAFKGKANNVELIESISSLIRRSLIQRCTDSRFDLELPIREYFLIWHN